MSGLWNKIFGSKPSPSLVKTRLEAGRRLFSEHRYNPALAEAIAILDVEPKNGEALDLAVNIFYLCNSAHSQEKIGPSISEDPLFDGLFNQCNRCHRGWPGNPSHRGVRGQLVITNPAG